MELIAVPFEPLQVSSNYASTVTIDKLYRLRISSKALRELKLSAYQYVVVSVDVENKRVGIAKQELAKVPNASALKVDKRGYLGSKVGKNITDKLAIDAADLPCVFTDIGNFDEGGVYWRAFEMVNPAE
jgi:hypothetical protein